MRRITIWAVAILSMVSLTPVGYAASPQSTTAKTSEVKHFEVVSVDGNKVVLKGERGAQEITVPEDFRFTVGDKQVSVHELKPGMKGTATITTTTTTTPVYVTEVKDGTVMQKSGNSIIVRGPNGIKMFSEGDVEKRGVKIYKGGQPVPFTDLNTGDKLTATIVTEKPPKVMTQRQVEATLHGAPAPAASTGTAAPAASTGTAAPAKPATNAPAGSTGTAAAAPKKLPKTASNVPLIGLIGIASLFVGVTLTARRRGRSA